jgi:hypothetical protein
VKNLASRDSSIGIESLLLAGFTVLMMSEEKAILRITADNYREKLDLYDLQDMLMTPYAVIVPSSQLVQNQ